MGALNLGHERYQLKKMIEALAADRGLDVHLRLAHLADRPRELFDFLPELSAVLGRHSVLVVPDNLETLPGGQNVTIGG